MWSSYILVEFHYKIGLFYQVPLIDKTNLIMSFCTLGQHEKLLSKCTSMISYNHTFQN